MDLWSVILFYFLTLNPGQDASKTDKMTVLLFLAVFILLLLIL